MYHDQYSEELTKKLAKLKRKDPVLFSITMKKMDSILKAPEHEYKFLGHDMKGINRVHIGHFVLIFIIDHEQKIVSFEDFDHHDNIYKP
jgi:YafQ family addiction module toxin component